MNILPKYSVIIPIYNAEKTLARCLDSLLCQLREDIQIILINDGSSDRSAEIAAEYVQRDSSIQLISQENAGVSRARNVGLSVAQGRYILFIDSDDYVRSDYFSVLDTADDSDLVVFCHEIIGSDPRDMSALFAELQKTDSFEDRLSLLLKSRRIMSPWDKRFKRSIIEGCGIRFQENLSIGEDFCFCMAYAVLAESIGILTQKIICNDITCQDSLSRKYRPALSQQMLEVYTTLTQTLRNCSLPSVQRDRLLAITDYLFVRNTFTCISEEFKACDLHYLRNIDTIESICRTFKTRFSDNTISILHLSLRLALKWNLFFPFYAVSYLVKGRKQSH